MYATFHPYSLHFKTPSRTSRGLMTEKETWFLLIEDQGRIGIGECGLLRGLSFDDRSDYKEKLQWVCDHIGRGEKLLWEALKDFPSLQFGVEMAFRSLDGEDTFILYPSNFTRGTAEIPINGLVWMGEEAYMKEQIIEKIAAGFSCIKLKIGAIDFEKEIGLLKYIRREFSTKDIEIRVDANGAFFYSEALVKLQRLSELHLHSIEQPIRPGQLQEMAALCEKSPLPIALDEELIGVTDILEKRKILQTIRPQYLIFKPSLIGGIRGTNEYINLANDQKIGWWITSALESNVGLNAIAQYCYTLNNKLPQGLGTGSLYVNNIDSPLEVSSGTLRYNPTKNWKFNI